MTYIQIGAIMRCGIRGLHCLFFSKTKYLGNSDQQSCVINYEPFLLYKLYKLVGKLC